MREYEMILTKMRIEVLKGVCKEYAGHTIENVVTQMESRVKEWEKAHEA